VIRLNAHSTLSVHIGEVHLHVQKPQPCLYMDRRTIGVLKARTKS
jgi:hypothetical protein